MPTGQQRDIPDSDGSSLLDQRMGAARPILLDGATGTELERRGHASVLPLWSSHALLDAPEAIAEIHADYVDSGAEIITANTFRTQSRVLEKHSGFRGRARELTRLAVSLAREATNRRPGKVWVAGSAPPLEDCYRPDWVPDAKSLEIEHREHADHLADAGVDLILVETMNCIGESLAAAHAAALTQLPFWISFICGSDGRLLSGEPLDEALEAVRTTGPEVVLVNCLPPSAVAPCLAPLAASGLAFGVYANLGAPYPNSPDQRREDCEPAAFAEQAGRWIAAGARVVGGCCGTTPEHIRALGEACLLDR
ncbi:MAG: homocysteine S-methyltransferase family protein [Myxococcales bacterium]|nr:homocysteine S-methyltransferase family protein [Myxococcales bacterium]MCH7868473.1 homocysteine S-methyltransferase family protein [Myxococcales bacterium]